MTSLQMISSGLTFDDGEQLLVSLQKPLGIVLEERDELGCMVIEVNEGGSAFGAGIEAGDVLVAVNNADASAMTLEEVMQRIVNAPRVVNLRFLRC